MINLSKSLDFFDPSVLTSRCHVIGCGSVGGFVAELLVRFGVTRIALYDFDTVEDKNVANQIFTYEDVGMNKCDATLRILKRINPEIDKFVKVYRDGYTNQSLSGHVFLCVDDIDLRRNIVSNNFMNINIDSMYDFRTRLTDSQHFAADWSDKKQVENLLKTMNFSNEDAEKGTEVSACGVSLCVAPTVRMVAEIGVMNFINFVKGDGIKNTVFIDTKRMNIMAFPE